eukprot:GHVT01087920.1.p1 GENE.GHVT01087920.1~~GHVT01087920.1.p1  ORF type:complete len:686 (+),score=65.68 GHVT01087920.1:1267-3324(+)
MYQERLPSIFHQYRKLKSRGVEFPKLDARNRYMVKNAEESPAFVQGASSAYPAPPGRVGSTGEQPNPPVLNRAISILNSGRAGPALRNKCMDVLARTKPRLTSAIQRLSADDATMADNSGKLAELLELSDVIDRFLSTRSLTDTSSEISDPSSSANLPQQHHPAGDQSLVAELSQPFPGVHVDRTVASARGSVDSPIPQLLPPPSATSSNNHIVSSHSEILDSFFDAPLGNSNREEKSSNPIAEANSVLVLDPINDPFAELLPDGDPFAVYSTEGSSFSITNSATKVDEAHQPTPYGTIEAPSRLGPLSSDPKHIVKQVPNQQQHDSSAVISEAGITLSSPTTEDPFADIPITPWDPNLSSNSKTSVYPEQTGFPRVSQVREQSNTIPVAAPNRGGPEVTSVAACALSYPDISFGEADKIADHVTCSSGRQGSLESPIDNISVPAVERVGSYFAGAKSDGSANEMAASFPVGNTEPDLPQRGSDASNISSLSGHSTIVIDTDPVLNDPSVAKDAKCVVAENSMTAKVSCRDSAVEAKNGISDNLFSTRTCDISTPVSSTSHSRQNSSNYVPSTTTKYILDPLGMLGGTSEAKAVLENKDNSGGLDAFPFVEGSVISTGNPEPALAEINESVTSQEPPAADVASVPVELQTPQHPVMRQPPDDGDVLQAVHNQIDEMTNDFSLLDF